MVGRWSLQRFSAPLSSTGCLWIMELTLPPTSGKGLQTFEPTFTCNSYSPLCAAYRQSIRPHIPMFRRRLVLAMPHLRRIAKRFRGVYCGRPANSANTHRCSGESISR